MTTKSRTYAIIALVILGFAAVDITLIATNRSAEGAEASSVEARLQRLEDREAIRDLIIEYGHMVDTRNWAGFANLFAQNGEWVGGMGAAKGRPAIQKMMEDSIGSNTTGKSPAGIGGPNFHIFANERITVDGNTATAVTKWMFLVPSKENHPQPYYLGHYDDRFVREDGSWKFLSRTAYGDIPPAPPKTAPYQPSK